jgi:hypothetical protein
MKTFKQFVLEMDKKTAPRTQIIRVERPTQFEKPTQSKTPDLVGPAIKTGVGAALRTLGAGAASGLAGSILSEPSSRTGDATLRGAVKSGDYKPTNKEKKQLFDR